MKEKLNENYTAEEILDEIKEEEPPAQKVLDECEEVY